MPSSGGCRGGGSGGCAHRSRCRGSSATLKKEGERGGTVAGAGAVSIVGVRVGGGGGGAGFGVRVSAW